MLEEIERLYERGEYEAALSAAKRISIDLLKQGDRAKASLALGRAGVILCALHSPSKARSFAQEAYDLATRSGDRSAAGFAEVVRALSHLRLGEFDRAEAALDHSLELIGGALDEPAAFAKLVASEISLAQEDVAESRAFAEDAYAIGASTNNPVLKAHARLIKAVCEERTEDYDTALDLLQGAEAELKERPSAGLAWQIRAAMANVCLKAGREKEVSGHRKLAAAGIDRIVQTLKPESRERFLAHPAVQSALGEETSSSGLFRVPVQVSGPPAVKDDTSITRLRPVFDVIKKINSELNLRKLITMILDTMIEFCNAQRGTLVIYEGVNFKVEISRDRHKEDLRKTEMGISRTILKMVRDRGKKVVTDDAHEDTDFSVVDSVHDQQLLSIMCVPLRVKTRLIGAVYLDNPHVVGAFGEREQELAEILTDQAAVAIDNALLRIRSIHDGLTSLYNHPHFEKRLEAEVSRARRHNRPCGLLMLDLDDFKRINDSYGHEAGNEVLRGVSRLIAGATRTGDLVARIQETDHTPVVARYGGDEFEIILPDTAHDGLRRVAERILLTAETSRVPLGGSNVEVRFSIGGAVFPQDAVDHRTLLLKADEALYAAKRSGKNRYCSYSDLPQATPPQPRPSAGQPA